jgi:hypothetical protein
MGESRYTGIGSRRTPPATLALMERIAARQARAGWVLRSGGSPGADQAFARGAHAGGGRLELYLPWPEFELDARAAGGSSPARVQVFERPAGSAYELASRFHPRWRERSPQERALLARDAHEVLGATLESPSDLVVCWTADGSLDGDGLLDDGTGQALRIAAASGVPVFNLARPDHLACWSADEASR